MADKIQTRFIPSVGWCIRFGSDKKSGTGGSGGYRVMFLDGVALEIDADEEYVEFRGSFGDISR
jgi:polo-like kinase 4